jgi:hypothetical protein
MHQVYADLSSATPSPEPACRKGYQPTCGVFARSEPESVASSLLVLAVTHC